MNLGDIVFIKPCEERTVINPVTGRAIASEGEWLQLTVHLLRRVRLGDCVIVPDAVQPDMPDNGEGLSPQ